MPTINETMLAAAKLVTPVRQSTATGGSTTTITDTKINAATETYSGGTAWVLSGTNAGACLEITRHVDNTLTLNGTLSTAITAGTKYAIAARDWPKDLLEMAVDAALEFVKVPTEVTATAVSGVLTLPADVFDVKQAWYNNTENYHWSEMAGVIRFDATTVSGTVTLKYKKQANKMTDYASGIIDNAVPYEHLVWSTVVFLWRNRIEKLRKDDPIATDLLNEAKSNEAFAKAKMNSGILHLPRSPRFSRFTA